MIVLLLDVKDYEKHQQVFDSTFPIDKVVYLVSKVQLFIDIEVVGGDSQYFRACDSVVQTAKEIIANVDN